MQSKVPTTSKSNAITAITKVALITSTLVIFTAQASPSFSNGHKKIERALEQAQNGNIDAMWTQYNVLTIAISKSHFNANAYSKSVCSFLQDNGFSQYDVKVVIADKNALSTRNQWSELAERDCR